MKYIVIFVLFLLILFLYASCTTISVPDLVYREAAMFQIWVSDKSFNISKSEKERNRYWYGQTKIDPITKKVWTISEDRNNNDLYLYDISSGTIEQEIALQFEENVSSNFDIFDNRVVLQYKQRGRYMIIDLLTNDRKELQIEKINGFFPFGYSDMPICFDGKSLVFSKGYYQIEDNSLHFFEKELKYPRYQSDGNIMIGIDEDEHIVFYDIYSNKIENTKIQRKRFSSTLEYGGIHLYYLDGRYLYVSRDIHNFAYVFATLPFVAPRKWYKYDLITQKHIRIDVPSNYIIILGSVRKETAQNDGTIGNAGVTNPKLEEKRRTQ